MKWKCGGVGVGGGIVGCAVVRIQKERLTRRRLLTSEKVVKGVPLKRPIVRPKNSREYFSNK
jgi:hypothetical protein